MSTQLTRLVQPSAACAIVAALALAACDRGEAPKSASAAAALSDAELSWARAALERNPELEVVATDPQTGVVTVSIAAPARSKRSRPASWPRCRLHN